MTKNPLLLSLLALLFVGLLACEAPQSMANSEPIVVDERMQEARVTRARTDMRTLQMGLERFHIDNGVYPRPKTWEADLSGTYIQTMTKDPWEREYIYSVPGSDGRAFDLLTYGRDGKPGGEGPDADLSVWDD